VSFLSCLRVEYYYVLLLFLIPCSIPGFCGSFLHFMKLVISQLKPGENLLSYSSEKEGQLKSLLQDLNEEGFSIKSPLEFTGTLHKHEPDYYLQGNLTWTIQQDCSRCAETFLQPLSHDFNLALAHSGLKQEDNENLDLFLFDGNDLDLKPLLHEQFVLSVPFQSICNSDCKGICQHCGKNLNRQECVCVEHSQHHPFSVLKNMTL